MKHLWDNNLVQFARVLSEINSLSIPLTADQVYNLRLAMELERGQLSELFERAMQVWEHAKKSVIESDTLIAPLYDTPEAKELRAKYDLLTWPTESSFEIPMTVGEIDHWMRLMHEHKLATTFDKSTGKWHWYHRDTPEEPSGGPHDTFIQALSDALDPYMKEEES